MKINTPNQRRNNNDGDDRAIGLWFAGKHHSRCADAPEGRKALGLLEEGEALEELTLGDSLRVAEEHRRVGPREGAVQQPQAQEQARPRATPTAAAAAAATITSSTTTTATVPCGSRSSRMWLLPLLS